MFSSHYPTFEFHISRQARDYYRFEQSLFTFSGNVIFTNFHAARLFAQKINQKRDLVRFPERAIHAGEINALGLIDEILHLVVALYRQQRNPRVMEQALGWLGQKIGVEAVENTLRQFVEEFPPLEVYQRQKSIEEYLYGETEGLPHRQIALEEMLMLWLNNVNPAAAPYLELFDHDPLERYSAYPQIITALQEFFASQPTFGPDQQNLIAMLRSPAIHVPHSISGQLEYIRTRWGHLLGHHLYRLLRSLDLIKEEENLRFAGLGPAPAAVYEYAALEQEVERFSPDRDWMPCLVLIAKNTYVWLDQLSKKYQRPITRLDHIPEEELATLARWGFSGLWLIGLWERSPASKRIKQLCGNPEAVASAYSLYSYDIAADLGGEDAFQTLRQRAWKYGIRLASDMVPNHMGIDSPWVVKHPDWFISMDYSPFPSYTFNGPNLSWDSRVGIYLEDHYYDHSDAAVVFKRLDFWSGQEMYIYHGNDGTSMPWNDTAQLNYLNPEVREAVIQTILHVARKFPIIRFDAAMTLTKRHYQRLWYPEPGGGGDIPSRAEHGMPKEQFDQAMPNEFWREVVDRVAQEVPDTLLLAEAFWLMEGYFVRTLGMHRVYNSAFMNMLRDERNQEYRLVIKNTLEFDPEILKRFVNFMNNPDERTAVDQFGKGDKYFGICTLMATLPGLPMFGHGQIEGFAEKYGMEFRHAYWDEQPDLNLIERHDREIFPLLRRRYLFAEAKDFLLYDFYTPEGYVNEDVFAYSNCSGHEYALVIYHNKFASTRGWIRNSVSYLDKSNGRLLIQKSLGEALKIPNESGDYTIFRDHISGLEYIFPSQDLYQKGLYLELGAYQYHVFLDIRHVQEDAQHPYGPLAAYLDGRGVPSVEEALMEIYLQSVRSAFAELVNPAFFQWLQANQVIAYETSHLQPALDEVEARAMRLLTSIQEITYASGDLAQISQHVRQWIASLLQINAMLELPRLETTPQEQMAQAYLQNDPRGRRFVPGGDPLIWGVLLGWIMSSFLGKLVHPTNFAEISRSWLVEWHLDKTLVETLKTLGATDEDGGQLTNLITLLISHYAWAEDFYQIPSPLVGQPELLRILQSWFTDPDVQRFLGFNRYQAILWFNREAFEEWLWWMYVVAIVHWFCNQVGSRLPGDIREFHKLRQPLGNTMANLYTLVKHLLEAAEACGYRVERFLEIVTESR